MGINWVRNNTPIKRITAPILNVNRKTLYFVRSIGFDLYGVNPCAALHNGLTCDVMMFGITV
jgi:hypothetical protein